MEFLDANSLERSDAFFHHRRPFVAFNAEVILALLFLQDDVDVASDKLHDLLSFGCLNGIILISVITKVESESVWRCAPTADSCQRPRLEDFLCSLVQSQDGVFSDTEQTWNQLVLPVHLLLDQEECDAVRWQLASGFCVLDFGIDFAHADELAMFSEDFLLDVLDAYVRERQEVLQAEQKFEVN